MARQRTRFVCQACGSVASRWLGRCPDCHEWNSLVEEVEVAARSVGGAARTGATALRLREISVERHPRLACGMGELDRVLGGGLVPGSLVLIGGDPGIGKSTLLLQATARLAAEHGTALYVSGEESPEQVRLRADRLGTLAPELYLLAETDFDAIEAQIARLDPKVLVLDSVQTVYDPALTSPPGTVSQVRGVAGRVMRLAKSTGLPAFLVGHVTKEGTLAGPRVLEHMVDAVLYFEGDRFQSHRVLRGVKNRFGSTDEIGLFEMTERGLIEVPNPSEVFLAQRPSNGAGSAVAAVLEGTRALLVEIQALVARSYLAAPRRMATGVDFNRLAMILAVLEKRCGLRMSDKDVYVNVAGGLKVVEPAVDLAIAAALASSYRDVPVDPDTVLAGEVGLAGEVRSVQQTEKRLREAARLGFARAVTARSLRNGGAAAPIERIEVTTLAEALVATLGDRYRHAPAELDPFADDEA